MKILTGKVLEDFNKWYTHPDNSQKLKVSKFTTQDDAKLAKLNWLSKSDIEQYAIIQEWLDSVGIIIITSLYEGMFYYELFYNNEKEVQKDLSKSRTEALKAAIIKANEIYNTRS